MQEFAGNTICEGTFDLPAGDYVVFSPSPEDLDDPARERESDVSVGVVSELTITEPPPSSSSPSTVGRGS